MSKAVADLTREQHDTASRAVVDALATQIGSADVARALDLAPAAVAVLELLADRTDATAPARAVLAQLLREPTEDDGSCAVCGSGIEKTRDANTGRLVRVDHEDANTVAYDHPARLV